MREADSPAGHGEDNCPTAAHGGPQQREDPPVARAGSILEHVNTQRSL